MLSSIIFNGGYIALLSITFLLNNYFRYLFSREGATKELNEQIFLTAFFCFFIFITNFNSFNVRTHSTNLFHNLISNKNFITIVGLIFFVQILFTYIGGNFLRTVGLTLREWITVVILAITILPIDIFRKKIIDPILERRYGHRLNNRLRSETKDGFE